MLIYGINAVRQAVSSGYPILKVYALRQVAHKLPKGLKIVEADRQKLLTISGTPKNQGAVAVVSPIKPVDFIELTEKTIKTNGYLVFLDRVEDPHNLGAAFRLCDAFGAKGIVIPRDRSATVTSTVVKVSTGSVFNVPFSVVPSFSNSLKVFKDKGGWLVGLERGGKSIVNYKFPLPLGIIAGSEGRGLSSSTRKFLDETLEIPMVGRINSINVSNALSIGLYLILTQKLKEV